ncbi:putative endoglucanase type K-like protein [Paramyrothecium foliicola]|nr:putative endoglucanase type K-like protein [Paramyrothecium foliicola]
MRQSFVQIAAVAASLVGPGLAASGSGKSTRYWDCCKPSCSWPEKASVSSPVQTCDKQNNPLSNPDATSGCDGGSAFTCANMSPFAVDDQLAYGFAATAINGETESSWCCACYNVPRLTFTDGPVAGKTMIVQSTNTGGDISNNHFDILMPGGGVGLFDGCTPQYGSIPGAQYGGVSSRAECEQMPQSLKAGCQWRFDWFQNADNPNFQFEQVQCPSQITAISGCKRSDDGSFPAA